MKVGAVYAAKCGVLARIRQRVEEACEKNRWTSAIGKSANDTWPARTSGLRDHNLAELSLKILVSTEMRAH